MSETAIHDPAQEEGRIPEILEHYTLPTPCRVSFLGVGAKSRAYLVEPEPDADALVLKLYGEGCRTRHQIEAELSLMVLLGRGGLPVVQPCARRDGSFVTDFPGRSVARHAVLLTRAPGEVVPRMGPAQAWHVGRALAQFHRVAKRLEGAPEIQAPPPPEKKWWTTHLDLSAPLARIGGLFESPEGRAAAGELSSEILERLHDYLLEIRRLDVYLRALTSRIELGICHGAYHFGNFSLDGETVTLFDLEAQCMAYQVTDLAMLFCDIGQHIHHLRKSGLSDDDPMLQERIDETGRTGLAVLEGYESERRLGEAERGCLLSHAPVALAIHIGELIKPGAPPLAQSEARIAVFLEEHASWKRLRRDLGWDHLDRL
jgi:Ser/Thr protein kinase RdoA (MazF antagonist)